MENYFAPESAAARYAADRPYFHPLVVERIVAYYERDWPVDFALDVACGTGMSTVALARLARHAIGVDVSAAMLAQAEAGDGRSFVQAAAEAVPFPAGQFELVTVALALHWFDRARFLSEMARVLPSGGALVIYNNGFTGQMVGNEAVQAWLRANYLTRFPTPPRAREPLTAEQVAEYGLAHLSEETFLNKVTFTVEGLCRYLTTQSNVIAAVERGDEKLADVVAWLKAKLAPFFAGEEAVFLFRNHVIYLTGEPEQSRGDESPGDEG